MGQKKEYKERNKVYPGYSVLEFGSPEVVTGFPRGGRQLITLAILFRKLHKIEEMLGREGDALGKCVGGLQDYRFHFEDNAFIALTTMLHFTQNYILPVFTREVFTFWDNWISTVSSPCY